jgi:N-acetylglucosaminyldiphosphoundecaprenol N-acetyl-beta-D-mannosaminyltransferase
LQRRPEFTELAEECFVGTVDGAARLIADHAVGGGGGYVCLCNVHVLATARHDGRLRSVLADAWLRLPDGAPVAWLQRRLGHAGAERVGGPDVMARVLDLGQASQLRHFLLGSTTAVLAGLERELAASFPGATIAGVLSPPFTPLTPSIRDDVLFAIGAAQPHLVWVGLGAPKQEYWMQELAPRAASPLFVGVGAAFDFLAGTTPRAPQWMRMAGLEWLHRLRLEPQRLAGRYLRTNTEFVVQTGQELARRRAHR